MRLSTNEFPLAIIEVDNHVMRTAQGEKQETYNERLVDGNDGGDKSGRPLR